MALVSVVCALAAVAAARAGGGRLVMALDTQAAPYRACAEPGLRALARREAARFALLTAADVAGAAEARDRALRAVRRDAVALATAASDGHFGKLAVLRAFLADDEARALAYVDLDTLVNERAGDGASLFAAAGVEARREPAVALYGQRGMKDAVWSAVQRINPRLRGRARPEVYWNSGVMVLNRAGARTLAALVDALLAAFVAREGAAALDSLPFFDQGFINAVLLDDAFGVRVVPLSFAWNASHSKFFYHHGNRFWLDEPEYADGERDFVPYIYHFMGCAGRGKTPAEGAQCKYERMQTFARSEFGLRC